MIQWYQRRLRLIETNCGREAGWFVVRGDERIAELSDCRWEEMYWDSYLITPTTNDADLNAALLGTFWESEDWVSVHFANREFPNLIVADAYPAMTPFYEPCRLVLRGLHFCPFPRLPWDYIILWWRARRPLAPNH